MGAIGSAASALLVWASECWQAAHWLAAGSLANPHS